MLTAAQYDRLPHMARAIVDADRSLKAMTGRPVISIEDAKTIRREMGERDRLVAYAHETWGNQLPGNGTVRR